MNTMFPSSSLRCLAALACLGVLSACGSFEDVGKRGKIDYKTTTQSKPLDVPPDLTAVAADDRFVVPDVGGRGVATASGMGTSAPASTPSVMGTQAVLVQTMDARIERNGNQRWLVINRPPEQVWPVVREFWLQAGFVLKVDKPEIGILETDWAENRAKIPLDGVRRIIGKVFDGLYSSDELDRYRTRLERVEGGTEIYVSHRGLREVYEDAAQTRTVWTPRATDPEMEAEFLNRLMERFVGETAKQAAQARPAVAAAAPGVEPRARLVSAGQPDRRLQVRDNFDRTWRRVGLALDRSGFAVEDRDRSKGLYYVNYRESTEKTSVNKPDDRPGLFARMFGTSKAAAEAVDTGRIEGRYRVRVAPIDGRTDVTVLTGEGQPLATAAADRILSLLENELR